MGERETNKQRTKAHTERKQRQNSKTKHLRDIYIRSSLKSWRVDLRSIICIRHWLPTPTLRDTCRRLAGLSQCASRKTRSGAPAKSLQLAGNLSQFEFFPFPISDLLTFLGGRTSLSLLNMAHCFLPPETKGTLISGLFDFNAASGGTRIPFAEITQWGLQFHNTPKTPLERHSFLDSCRGP